MPDTIERHASDAERHSPSAPARVLLAMLGLYRAWSSARPPVCRYVPTCSAYAREALERHGAFRGTYLAAWRLLRCNPVTTSGYALDPVPAPRER